MVNKLTKIIRNTIIGIALLGISNTNSFSQESKDNQKSLTETIQILKSDCENNGECVFPLTYNKENSNGNIFQINLGYENQGVFGKEKSDLILPPGYNERP